jgi:hypothetical protein
MAFFVLFCGFNIVGHVCTTNIDIAIVVVLVCQAVLLSLLVFVVKDQK